MCVSVLSRFLGARGPRKQRDLPSRSCQELRSPPFLGGEEGTRSVEVRFGYIDAAGVSMLKRSGPVGVQGSFAHAPLWKYEFGLLTFETSLLGRDWTLTSVLTVMPPSGPRPELLG
jgi:hypothetical protein